MSGTNPGPDPDYDFESGPAPRIPSVGGDPRERSGAAVDPPEKIWFRNLDEAVIETDRCIECGSCVAACPSNSIGIDEVDGRPTLVRMCTGCSSCWDYCPRGGLRYERVVALAEAERGLDELRTYTARAASEDTRAVGQDGGVVTELLATLLDAGEIDGAVVATTESQGRTAETAGAEAAGELVTAETPDEPLRGTAALATSREALLAGSGSVYNQVMSLGRIDDLVERAGLEDPRLALVGTPCVIQGASALERYDHGGFRVSLTVALMCTRAFEHGRLVGTLTAHGVDPGRVDKLDVSDGRLYAFDADGSVLLREDVEKFAPAGLRGCDECADFVGGAADLSAGSIASEEGRTTVVVRTRRGERAWKRGVDSLDVAPLDRTGALEKIADWNRRRARHFLAREYDSDGPVGISYTDHREAYDGTNRGPEPLNPARVHQYEEWC